LRRSGAVPKYQRAVRAAGIGAAGAKNLSEAELEQRVFGPAQAVKAGALVAPDCAWIHNQLKRHRQCDAAAAVGGVRATLR
jgi:hypothetical protein